MMRQTVLKNSLHRPALRRLLALTTSVALPAACQPAEPAARDVIGRLRRRADPHGTDELQAIRCELHALQGLFGRRGGALWSDDEKAKKAREIVARTLSDVEAILAR